MKAEDVYKSIEAFVYNHDFKLQNVFVHAWEADCFSVTSSKYTYEIEVKVSRSDFFADMKKPKHHFFKTLKGGCGIYPIAKTIYPEGKYSNLVAQVVSHKNAPNKFFFACPVGLVEIHEVPKYAGLIYVMDSGSHRIIKPAPFIHRDPFDQRTMLFDKYFYKWQNLKDENWKLKVDNDWLRAEIQAKNLLLQELQRQPLEND